MTPQTLLTLNAERAAAIVVTDIASGDQRLVKAADIGRDPLREVLEAQLRAGKSGTVEVGGRKLFLNVHAPAARLAMVGAVHISQARAPMARILDYDVTIVDPRTAFASLEHFPDVPLIAEWPDVALPPLNIDFIVWRSFSAVVPYVSWLCVLLRRRSPSLSNIDSVRHVSATMLAISKTA